VPVADLREWIERVDAMGELARVDGADAASDIGGITDLYQWDMANPALLFDRIKGYPAEAAALRGCWPDLFAADGKAQREPGTAGPPE
jgi:3-polyprenyl-4-hydroxybenzoate decarboxylase